MTGGDGDIIITKFLDSALETHMIDGTHLHTPHGMGETNKKLIGIPDEMTAYEYHSAKYHKEHAGEAHPPVLHHDIHSHHAPVLDDWHLDHHGHFGSHSHDHEHDHEMHSPFHFYSSDDSHHQHDDPHAIHLPPEVTPHEFYHYEMYPEDYVHPGEEHYYPTE